MLSKRIASNKHQACSQQKSQIFFHCMLTDESLEEARRLAIARSLEKNRFSFLLKLPKSPHELKKLILEHVKKRWPENNQEFLEETMKYVDRYYEGVLRKDGKTKASAHVYSVAYGCLLLGCSLKTFITALFHDVLEDTKEDWAKRKYRKVKAEIACLAGKDVADDIAILTRKEEPYIDYLRRIYQSQNMELMVIKAVDMINNLSTLYFEGCSRKLKQSTVQKALYHVDIWRKFNREFFELMFALIKDNAPRKPRGKADAEIIRRIEYLSHPSMRQIQKEKYGLVIVNPRKSLDLSLFSDLPNSGSPVITVYMPRHLDAEEIIEVEFPESFGSPQDVLSRVQKEIPWMKFEKSESALPSGLVCTTILKTGMPPAERQEEFIDSLRRLIGKRHH
ncbi:MAG: hypothetical protein N3F07_02030 [Candidatus Micrarchaeota archaeon]|nr:hypothetical protein [Candidatus Micrarchaeota archaeon]